LRRSLAPQFVQKDDNGKVTGFDNEGLYNAMLSQGADPMTINSMRMKQVEMQKALLGLSSEQRQQVSQLHSDIQDSLETVQHVYDKESKANPQGAAPQPTSQGPSLALQSSQNPAPQAPNLMAMANNPIQAAAEPVGKAPAGTPESLGQQAPGAAPTQTETSLATSTANAPRPVGPLTQQAYQQQIMALAQKWGPQAVSQLSPFLHDASEIEQAEAGVGSLKEAQNNADKAADIQEKAGKGAQSQAEAEASQWKPAGEGTLVNFKTGQMIHGVAPVDRQELAAYLNDPSLDAGKNKNAATFASWKLHQSPMAMVMGNQLPQGSPALDQAAERYSQTGVLPPGFVRSPGTLTAIMNRAAELHPEANIAGNEAVYKANQKALGSLQDQFSKVSAFEGTALKNLDLYTQKVQAIPDLGVKFANVPLREITSAMIGEQNYAAMQAARQVAATETAKVLGSATASGVLSDSQKKEAMDVLDGNLPYAATLQVVNTLKQDFANRHQSYQQEIGNLHGMVNKQQGGGSDNPPPPPATGGFSWDNMPKHTP
jgi:hypothetical protein